MNPLDGNPLLHALAQASIHNPPAFEDDDDKKEEESDESMDNEGSSSSSEEESSSSSEEEESGSDSDNMGHSRRKISTMGRRRTSYHAKKARKANRNSETPADADQVT